MDGFYAAYLTGSTGNGIALLVMREFSICGTDVAGVLYDGTYKKSDDGYVLTINVRFPPNTSLIQGGTSSSAAEQHELLVHLPGDFLQRDFIRINAKDGPVNAKFVKIRDLK